jgi:hypothetical protein
MGENIAYAATLNYEEEFCGFPVKITFAENAEAFSPDSYKT